MIDRATVDKIIDATDIVDVVSEFVSLRKTGVNYKGLCPFHDDKTPSFIVSPAKGICHCFACGKGGNAVNFLMEHEQITYPEALRWLAKKYNIEIEEREQSDEERRERSERESMFAVNEWAAKYFQSVLNEHADGKAFGAQYFKSRDIRADIIERFSLGYALGQRDALSVEARRKGYQEEFLVKTGLCYKKDNGPLIDRYAGRVIFPWYNVSGKVCAFGGRLLDSRTKGVQQKYVNSPESEIYHKERELYGLYQAKRAIVKEDCVYMVEGYTDVIAMHQCGIENVVANSGTALSKHQIKLLRRFTQNIVLLYDGDEAGIHAAMRGTDMLLAEDMNVKVLLLPDGDDPDSFSKKHSPTYFVEYIKENQTDFIEFKTKLTIQGVTDPVKRSEAIGGIIKSVSVIPNPITRDTYLHQCAHTLQMSERTLLNTMNAFIRGDIADKQKEREREARKEEQAAQQGGGTSTQALPQWIGLHGKNEQAAKIEQLLIQTVVKYGDTVIFKDVETEDGGKVNLNVAQYVYFDLSQDNITFSEPLYNRILEEAVTQSEKEDFKAETYFVHHADADISRLASTLAVNRYHVSASLEVKEKPDTLCLKVTHLVMDYRLNILDTKLKDIQHRMKLVTADTDAVMQLMTEYRDTQQLRDVLAKKLGSEIII